MTHKKTPPSQAENHQNSVPPQEDEKKSGGGITGENRLKNLQTRIDAFDTRQGKKSSDPQQKDSKFGSDMALAFRACTELILSIAVCGVVGYFADLHISPRPWGLIAGLLIGTAIGFSGIYRILNGMDMRVGYGPLRKKSRQEKNDPPPGQIQ